MNKILFVLLVMHGFFKPTLEGGAFFLFCFLLLCFLGSLWIICCICFLISSSNRLGSPSGCRKTSTSPQFLPQVVWVYPDLHQMLSNSAKHAGRPREKFPFRNCGVLLLRLSLSCLIYIKLPMWLFRPVLLLCLYVSLYDCVC